MKNILFIISSLQSGWWAEKVCSSIWTKLQEKWYNTHFLTFYDYQKEKLYPFKWNYFSLNEKFSNNFLIKLLKLFKRAYQIKKYCKKNKIDTTISFMEEANFSNIWSKILFLNKSKINISIRQSVNAWWKLYQFLIKRLYNFSDWIITIVKEEKENLIKNYWIKKEKIKVIYNPIDIEKIKKLSQED
jgi:glycosyltransferase involved in cell wall biosynthesis